MRPTLSDFYYRISGPREGRKWVFLHGLLGYANNWGRIVRGLSSSDCCLTYDQRGHGRSWRSEDINRYALSDYADDLKVILDALGWERVILVGHSMGARVGLQFAVQYPKRVDKFIFVDITPTPRPERLAFFRALLDCVPTPFSSREQVREFFTHEFQKLAPPGGNSPMVAEFLKANLRETANGHLDWQFHREGVLKTVELGHQVDGWAQIQSLEVPTLVIRGERSQDLSEQDFRRLLESNSMIQGVTIPGAGHWVHAEQPEAFLGAIRSFADL
ncbi:MAG: alpha/beta hydrolase [Bdellovibrionaceae bacterium]|nr:alpha/beta hydrolase [Pseudobdellovibrionaceae bacterium]